MPDQTWKQESRTPMWPPPAPFGWRQRQRQQTMNTKQRQQHYYAHSRRRKERHHGRAPLLSLLVALATQGQSAAGSLPVIELGACGKFDSQPVHVMNYAAKVALEEGFLDDVVPYRNFTVSIRGAKTDCDSSEVSTMIFPLLLGEGEEPGRIYAVGSDVPPVRAISGCTCSDVSSAVALLGVNLQVPMVSGSSTNQDLSNKNLYSYFARTVPPDDMQGAGVATLIETLGALAPLGGWSRVAILQEASLYAEGVAAALVEALSDDFTVYRESVPQMPLSSAEDAASYEYSGILAGANRLKKLSPVPRVFFIASAAARSPPLFRAFDEVGLFDNPSVLFVSEAICDSSALTYVMEEQASFYAASLGGDSAYFWEPDGYDWSKIPVLATGMLCLMPTAEGPLYESQEWLDFWTGLTPQKLWDAGMDTSYEMDETWFQNLDIVSSKYWYPLVFDAMTTLFVAIGTLFEEGYSEDEIQGELLRDAIFSTVFDGLSGNVSFDSNGDRLAPYSIMNVQSTNDEDGFTFVNIGEYSMITGTLNLTRMPVFSTGSQEVPADRPEPCEAGLEFTSSGCVLCDAGTYSPTEDSTCIACSEGNFAAESGMTRCVAAPKGYYVEAAGSTNYSMCERGTYTSDAGSTACELCAEGYYAEEDAATSCKWCPSGSYSTGIGSSSCSSCPAGTTTEDVGSSNLSQCECAEGSYLPKNKEGCFSCPVGMECPFGSTEAAYDEANSTSTYPLVLEGYMTLREDPLRPFLCLSTKPCPGGSPGSCSDFRDGSAVACGECVHDAYEDGDACKKCDAPVDFIPSILFVSFAAFLLVAIVFIFNGDISKRTHLTLVCTLMVGLSVSALQTLGVMAQLALTWPEPVATLLSRLKVITFDLQLLKVPCITTMSGPTSEYVARQCVAPCSVPIILTMVYVKKRWSRSDGLDMGAEAINTIGAAFSILFISIVVACLGPLVCYLHPDQERWSMRTAPSILCFEGGRHSMMLLVGAASFFLVPIPFIALVIWGTWKYPDLVRGRGSKRNLLAFRFLFVRFRPQRYFYSSILLARSLMICIVPVCFRDAATQITILSGGLTLFGMLQTRLFPWRSQTVNILDSVSCAGFLMMLICGGLISEVSVSDTYVSAMSAVAFVVVFLLFFGIIAACVVLQFCVCHRPTYSKFICHHKADAAAQARLLKTKLVERNKERVFIDSDDLQDLDTLFSTVKSEVSTLVVYLTRDTLRRPWCAGEVTTALLWSKASVVRVVAPGFVEPTLEQISNVEVYIDQSGCSLAQYHIHDEDISDAFVRLLSDSIPEVTIHSTLRGCARLEYVAEKLSRMQFGENQTGLPAFGRRTSGTSTQYSSAEDGEDMRLPPVPTDGNHIIISVEHDNDESIASAGILCSELSEKLFIIFGSEDSGLVVLCDRDCTDVASLSLCCLRAKALIMLLSYNSMHSLLQLTAILEVMTLRETITAGEEHHQAIIPVALSGFQFPTDDYYDIVLPRMLPDAWDMAERCIRAFFKLIALPFSCNASAQILSVQAAEVLVRIPSKPVDKEKLRRISKAWDIEDFAEEMRMTVVPSWRRSRRTTLARSRATTGRSQSTALDGVIPHARGSTGVAVATKANAAAAAVAAHAAHASFNQALRARSGVVSLDEDVDATTGPVVGQLSSSMNRSRSSASFAPKEGAADGGDEEGELLRQRRGAQILRQQESKESEVSSSVDPLGTSDEMPVHKLGSIAFCDDDQVIYVSATHADDAN